MAITKKEIFKITNRNEATQMIDGYSLGDGIALDFTGDDNKVFFMTNGGSATIKGGNSGFGGADLELLDGYCAVIDSGRFKNVSGEYKDHILITGATGSVISVFEMP